MNNIYYIIATEDDKECVIVIYHTKEQAKVDISIRGLKNIVIIKKIKTGRTE